MACSTWLQRDQLQLLRTPALLTSALLTSALLTHAAPLQPGERCVCVEDGLPTWVCELMAVKPTVHEAISFIKHVEQSMELPIVPHKQH